jgi:cell division protein FtsW (lipid II flippase)
MRTRLLLILFALPSVIGSVLLIHLAGAGQSLQVQQIIVALIVISIVLWMDKVHRNRSFENISSIPQQIRNSVLMLALMLIGLIACFAFSEAGNPSRWLKLGGLRLYFSAAVLPIALYVLAKLHWRLQSYAYANFILMLAFATILALQPDVSQLIAFAIAALFIVWHRTGSLVLKIAISVVVGLLCYWCWQQPDQLQPMSYVEGVIQLSGGAGNVAMLAAILSVALIPIGLFFVGIKHSSPELIPIAFYYIVIIICAYLGLTPMPLLGFGAGPVLGYFAVLLMRRNF